MKNIIAALFMDEKRDLTLHFMDGKLDIFHFSSQL